MWWLTGSITKSTDNFDDVFKHTLFMIDNTRKKAKDDHLFPKIFCFVIFINIHRDGHLCQVEVVTTSLLAPALGELCSVAS